MSPRRLPASPTELAAVAFEAIRAMNHATLGPNGWQYPGDVYATLGDLTYLAHMLPQLFTQTTRWLERAEAGGRMRTDDPALDLGREVDGARRGLADAIAAAQSLGTALDVAHEHTACLAATNTAADPEEDPA
jgi:hypothetical protein